MAVIYTLTSLCIICKWINSEDF
uniref:Uncharacterized protein n=1 Tax=Rhizophora mucronata TaxID=61149 RepID=A0A2P2MQF6_RHIMU